MTSKSPKPKLTEAEIDTLIAAQADNDSAWERPVRVRKSKAASISLSADLASRAAFIARLHRHKSAEAWLAQIIEERIEVEEAAFAGIKRELAQSES